jgi:acetyl esterase/lipase
MRVLLLCVLVLTSAVAVNPRDAQKQQPLPLWSKDVPGALGNEEKDTPTITPYLPDSGKANGSAMVICPGGAYQHLAQHEGEDYAIYLNSQGVTAFVLKYRLGSDGYRHPIMLQDAARAIRFVRCSAEKWKLDPKRIGIMGSSAGGHLASTLLTHFDAGNPNSDDPVERESSRPDLGVLCYPVISMGPLGHSGSRRNLLGENPSSEDIKSLSNELQVTKDTPPCLIWHTWEDQSVSVQNSLEFAAALQRNAVPFDLHIYQKGRHGIGLADKYPFSNVHPWARDLVYWLKAQGFVE